MLRNNREHGNIIQQLSREPQIATAMEALTQREVGFHVDYMANRIVREYGVPLAMSKLIIEIVLGLSNAAGHRVSQGEDDLELIEDVLVSMLVASINAAAIAYKEDQVRNIDKLLE